MTPYELFERCNETELYQIARASGVIVSPSATKDQLIKYIIGEELPPSTPQEFDEWRLAIMRFVIEHRAKLEVQLRCPAKSMDPRACFQCVDQQVVSCLVDNKNNLNLIRLHKKPIEYPTPIGDPMTTAAVLFTPQNAPRDAAKIIAGGTFQMRRLADSLGMLPAQEQQMAFSKLTPPERAEAILKALLEYDSKNGGAPPAQANGAAPANGTTANGTAAANAATADSPGASVATVDPAAFKNAQEATAPGPGIASPGKRQPKTTSASDSDLAALVVALQNTVQGGNSAVTQALNELRAAAQNSAVVAQLQAIEKALQEQTTVMKCTLMAVLTIAEERGTASRFDILADAMAEAENLDAMMREVRSASGKAA